MKLIVDYVYLAGLPEAVGSGLLYVLCNAVVASEVNARPWSVVASFAPPPRSPESALSKVEGLHSCETELMVSRPLQMVDFCIAANSGALLDLRGVALAMKFIVKY